MNITRRTTDATATIACRNEGSGASGDDASVKTFADSKNVSMFTTSKSQASVWDFM